MAAPGTVDPTKSAKYPIILSDALLGKSSKETYTGIRYNHRPALSSDTAPGTARLKKSARDGQFNLGYDDNGDKYQFSGTRTTDDGNYVLIFDPARKAFVLHRVDSLFHMNITRTPDNGNVESLRKQFPQLEVKGSGSAGSSSNNPPSATGTGKQAKGKAAEKATLAKASGASKGKESANPTPKATPKAAPKAAAKVNKNTKTEKGKPMTLTLPTMSKAPSPAPPPPAPAPTREEQKPKRRARSPVESEEEDDDDDFGLTIEYPGGPPPSSFPPAFPPAFAPTNNFSPAFPAARRFSEFVRGGHEEEDEDADAEFDDMIDLEEEDESSGAGTTFKLPSPINNAAKEIEVPERFEFVTSKDEEDAPGETDAEFEDVPDLEAELEREFLMVGNEVSGGGGHDSDSSMSEEE
ncbi:RNA polymerase II transcription elongation factor-domain-containing protein [Lasiosphaeria hispida]|uniref:RNA polymerase II transcription elongation factor-domain-containing protein n=1 Tax=Lasiosphaeria hispida TaxID=260671 RepID=A0AAJ0MKA4_9PEZI|nr:RNA polymerase II transcription elongation factor-domain-containing protein [Lasiosphaeria hispida]